MTTPPAPGETSDLQQDDAWRPDAEEKLADMIRVLEREFTRIVDHTERYQHLRFSDRYDNSNEHNLTSYSPDQYQHINTQKQSLIRDCFLLIEERDELLQIVAANANLTEELLLSSSALLDAKNELVTLKCTISELERILRLHIEEKDNILKSRSWQFTKPFRRFLSVLRAR